MLISEIGPYFTTVTLDNVDCAMLGKICRYSLEWDLFTDRDQEAERVALENYCSSFQAMATAALALGTISAAQTPSLRGELAAAELPARTIWMERVPVEGPGTIRGEP